MATCNCSWCDTRAYRDFRQDHGSDGFEETKYRKTGGKKKPRHVRVGCPGNDGKAHVYVWTSENEETGTYRSPWSDRIIKSFYAKHGYHRMEAKTCVGCGKVAKKRYTEEFQKRVAKYGWYQASYADLDG
jgi:hypothetical protein